MIDFFTVLLLFPAYFLSLYTPRFALSFRPGRVYSLGFTAYVFAISLCKTVLDFRWQVYGTGQSASFLLSVVISFTLPAAYHLCFGGDRYWRTGLILPFVCLQNLLLFPAFLPIMNLVAPLTWGLVLPIVGIFYLGMAYTTVLTVLALRRGRPLFEALPRHVRAFVAVASPVGYQLMNLQQLITVLYYGGRTREVWIIGCFGIPYIAMLALLMSWYSHRQSEQALGYAAAREQMQQNALQAERHTRETLQQMQSQQQQHLLRVQDLLEQGCPDRALEELRTLTRDTGGPRLRYADNPVADVALADAARRCAQYGLELRIDGNLPRQCTLPPVDLASLLYNLLSNAVASAAAASRPAAVEVHFRTMAGRLCVTVRNPVGGNAPRRGPDHGFGMRILREITARHDGSYTLDIREGRATAVAMVSLPERGQDDG